MKILNSKTVVQFLSQEKEEMVGYLWKRRSESKGSFKRRYFVACGNLLAYYEKKGVKDPDGLLVLEGHIIEMLDDLTMALRFPLANEIVRSYILRADSAAEIEQWMRVLTRSGLDYFTLTLEDLEDQFTAVTTVQQSLSFDNPASVGDKQRDAPRSNPFNRASIIYGELRGEQQFSQTSTSKRLANTPPRPPRPPPPPLLAATLPSTHTQAPTLSQTLTTLSDREPTPGCRAYIPWLLTQTWDELHDRVRLQLLEPKTESDLIDLG